MREPHKSVSMQFENKDSTPVLIDDRRDTEFSQQ